MKPDTFDFMIKGVDKISEARYYGRTPIVACRKVLSFNIRRSFIPADGEYSVIIKRLKDEKKYYYKCFCSTLTEPIIKQVAGGKLITIRNDINIVKINSKMVNVEDES